MRIPILVGTALLLLTSSVNAESLSDFLVSPEILLSKRSDLELTNDQVTKIEEITAATKEELSKRKQDMVPYQKELRELLAGQASLDEEKILETAKKLLKVENKAKLIQLESLVQVQNQLTDAQRSKIQQMRRNYANLIKERVQPKVQEIQTIAKKLADKGHSLKMLQERMKTIDQLVKAGRISEAEKWLDKTLDDLNKAVK